MREVYQEKNTLLGKTSKRATQIRDSSGNVIKDETSSLQRWVKFFKELLNTDEPEELIDFLAYRPTFLQRKLTSAKTHPVEMSFMQIRDI